MYYKLSFEYIFEEFFPQNLYQKLNVFLQSFKYNPIFIEGDEEFIVKIIKLFYPGKVYTLNNKYIIANYQGNNEFVVYNTISINRIYNYTDVYITKIHELIQIISSFSKERFVFNKQTILSIYTYYIYLFNNKLHNKYSSAIINNYENSKVYEHDKELQIKYEYKINYIFEKITYAIKQCNNIFLYFIYCSNIVDNDIDIDDFNVDTLEFAINLTDKMCKSYNIKYYNTIH